MINIQNLLNEHREKLEGLDNNNIVLDIADELCGYDSGFFEDNYREIVESGVDIYNKDLLLWLGEYVYEYESYINENTPIEDFDLYDTIRQAQFYYFNSLVLDNEEDVFMFYVYNYILNELKVEEIGEDKYLLIKNTYGDYTDLSDLREQVKTLLKGEN
jgi:hypothetical protein